MWCQNTVLVSDLNAWITCSRCSRWHSRPHIQRVYILDLISKCNFHSCTMWDLFYHHAVEQLSQTPQKTSRTLETIKASRPAGKVSMLLIAEPVYFLCSATRSLNSLCKWDYFLSAGSGRKRELLCFVLSSKAFSCHDAVHPQCQPVAKDKKTKTLACIWQEMLQFHAYGNITNMFVFCTLF